jgi:hypothetical protein
MSQVIKYNMLPKGRIQISIDGWIQGIVNSMDDAINYIKQSQKRRS